MDKVLNIIFCVILQPLFSRLRNKYLNYALYCTKISYICAIKDTIEEMDIENIKRILIDNRRFVKNISFVERKSLWKKN